MKKNETDSTLVASQHDELPAAYINLQWTCC
jgi:hypothetical protein